MQEQPNNTYVEYKVDEQEAVHPQRTTSIDVTGHASHQRCILLVKVLSGLSDPFFLFVERVLTVKAHNGHFSSIYHKNDWLDHRKITEKCREKNLYCISS